MATDRTRARSSALTYAAIMVYADGSPAGDVRLRLGASLANLFDAVLIGVGAAEAPALEAAAAAQTARLRAAQRAGQRFRPIASYVLKGRDWREASGSPSEALIGEARAADLILLSPPDRSRTSAFPAPDHGEVLMRAGRPILVAPAGQATIDPCRVLIGWKDTRECRRAVHDALPFLRHAVQVRVVEICSHAGRQDAKAGVKDVAAALRRHGVEAISSVIAEGDENAAAVLRAACEDWEADLLVAGGHIRSPAREWIFGGVTRDLLDAVTTPLLLSC